MTESDRSHWAPADLMAALLCQELLEESSSLGLVVQRISQLDSAHCTETVDVPPSQCLHPYFLSYLEVTANLLSLN